MLSNREFTDEEMATFGSAGRVRANSGVNYGERIGVILVHGRAGNENVMWVFSKAIEELDPIIIAPRALEIDPIGGYSWWNLDNRPATSESTAPVATNESHLKAPHRLIDNMVKKLTKMYGVDPSKILAIGFSQGGAVLGTYALLNPGVLSGVGFLSSFIPSYFINSFNSNSENKTKFFMSHGTKDDIIPYSRALETKDFFIKNNLDLNFHSDDVAHKISSSGIRELKTWLNHLYSPSTV